MMNLNEGIYRASRAKEINVTPKDNNSETPKPAKKYLFLGYGSYDRLGAWPGMWLIRNPKYFDAFLEWLGVKEKSAKKLSSENNTTSEESLK